MRPNHVNGRKGAIPLLRSAVGNECQKLTPAGGFPRSGQSLSTPARHVSVLLDVFDVQYVRVPVRHMLACGDMIFGGVMERFPN